MAIDLTSTLKKIQPNNSNLQTGFELIVNQQFIENEVTASNDVLSTVSAFNEELTKRNQLEVEKNTDENGKYIGVHGMSEEEYDQYQAWMYYEYGIEVENLSVGNFQSAAVSMERAIGKQWADEMAASYDSVLDLVLDEKLNQAMNEMFGEGSMPNWNTLYASRNTLLTKYGIQIDCLDPENTHKTFSVSLVDSNGNVIMDENGKLAQTIKNDLIMPDGLAQRNEIFNSAVLDMMGYDCFSVLDLNKDEYNLIKEMAQMDNSELGSSSSFKGNDGHGLRNEIRQTLREKNGVDAEGKIIKTDCSDWINGTYVNEVTGEVTGRKAYWSDFYKKRDGGYYSTRINNVTGESVNWVNRTITRNMYANYEATGQYSNGKIKAKRGGYSASNNAGSSMASSLISQDNYSSTNSISENTTDREKAKIKISKQEFEKRVEQLVTERNIGEIQAKEIVSEKYEIDYEKSYAQA